MNKRTLHILLGIGLILIAGIAIWYFGFKAVPLVVFPYGSNTNAQLTSSNSFSNTYLITISNRNPTTGSCNVAPQSSWTDYISPNNIYYSGVQSFSDLALNELSNITGGSVSDTSGNGVPIIGGNCAASTWNGNSIICNVQSQYSVYGCYTSSYYYSVTLPKTGYCLDSSQCSSGQTCQNNICAVTTQTYYELSNNSCLAVQKLSSQITSNDYSTLTQCQANIVPSPPVLNPPSNTNWFNGLLAWISEAWQWLKSHFGLSITGPQTITAGQSVSYLINLSSPAPAQCSSFTTSCGQQWGNWFLSDSNNNIVNSGTAQAVNGTYLINVSLVAPSNPGGYVLTGSIWETDIQYNPSTLSWMTTQNGSVANETYGLADQVPTTPNLIAPSVSSWFGNLLNSIIKFFSNFFKNL